MTKVYAHRGASAYAPENTMAAFEMALEMGADGIELDVQMSRNGHLVVIHDPTLERTTDGSGLVAQYTLAELRRVDAGAWFDERFRGQRIPTLAEVFELVRGKALLNVELKVMPVRYPGIEEALVKLVEDTGFPVEDLIISSFEHLSLLRVQSLEPRLAIAALFSHYPTSFASLPGTIMHPQWPVVDEEFMAKARAEGRTVNVWTADDPRAWERLAALGVDGIITNTPDKLIQWLNR